MKEQLLQRLNAFHWHEALDRTCICMEMVDRYLLFHPAIERNEALKGKAEQAHQLLYEIYQEIGGLALGEKDDK